MLVGGGGGGGGREVEAKRYYVWWWWCRLLSVEIDAVIILVWGKGQGFY